MNRQWTKEEVWAWYDARPWLRGCNYVPSCCVNREEFWQEYQWEATVQTIRRELALAADIGFNTIRVGPSFPVWKAQHDGFLARLEEFLGIAAEYGIAVMFYLGNDCCPPKELYKEPVLGEFPPPDPGYHGGYKRSVHALAFDAPGYNIMDDPAVEQEFYRFADEITSRYAKDERVVIWDVYNEPGNSHRGTMSLSYMENLFAIIRAHDPIQPLTAGAWSSMPPHLTEIEQRAVELSDLVSFHGYDDYLKTIETIQAFRQIGRPLLNTEWLHRCYHNTVEEMFPLFCLEKIGCYNWGLVAGKSQTYEPWESLYHNTRPEWDMTKWQHDLFRQNGRPYDPKEIAVIKRFAR